MPDLERLKAITSEKRAEQQELARLGMQNQSNSALQETVIRSIQALADYLGSTTTKTAVVNQLKEIGTPDALKVVEAVDKLHETVKSQDKQDQTKIENTLLTISKTMKRVLEETTNAPTPLELKQIDYTDHLQNLQKAIKMVEKAVKSSQNTTQPQVPSTLPLEKKLEGVIKAVKGVKVKETKIDLKPLEKELKSQHKTLKEIAENSTSSGGGGSSMRATPYEDSAGIPKFIVANPDGSLPVGSASVSSSTTSGKITVGSASTSVLSANSDRLSLAVVNDSDETIYINLSGTAVMNEGIRLNASGGSFETDKYTGAVTAICSSGSKNLTVTEL